MFGQPLLGDRDEQLHAVALLLPQGDFQILPAECVPAIPRCSLSTAAAACSAAAASVAAGEAA